MDELVRVDSGNGRSATLIGIRLFETRRITRRISHYFASFFGASFKLRFKDIEQANHFQWNEVSCYFLLNLAPVLVPAQSAHSLSAPKIIERIQG